jgi:DNA replication protein DnaC
MQSQMKPVGTFMDEIKRRVERIKAHTKTHGKDGLNKVKFRCEKCKDTEWIWVGWEAARPCECQEQRKYERRMKGAMIPDEFKNANLDTYIQENPMQQEMFQLITDYLSNFDRIRHTPQNSLGFVAKYGESRMKDKGAKKHDPRYNSYGLGKTHLQVAAAKYLIEQGVGVLIVSDVAIMDELSNARMVEDGGEEYNRIMSRLIEVPVLVWDDLGKSNPTEAKRKNYFQIVNERYKACRPILFSSNEDFETLSERIGGATASRLMGMARDYLKETFGPDFRATGGCDNGTASSGNAFNNQTA